MSEMGGFESFSPSEEQSGVSEAAREQAAQRFAAAQQALQQLKREEKRAKKRDDGVAQVILQFLTDTQKTHLATLISRLVSANCPSTFVLAVLSLINEQCRTAVEEYLRENQIDLNEAANLDQSIIPANSALTEEANKHLAAWVMRMDLTMRVDQEKVLNALLVDDHNIDGTILQLTTFVLQEFLATQEKTVPFESLQHLSVGILQTLFQPYMHVRNEQRLADAAEKQQREEESE